MDFYYADISAPCRSVMLTAKALGITLNKKPVDLVQKRENMKPEFLAINPQHCLPTIVDGDLKLWESRAICTYLINKYGKDDSLYPKCSKTRAQIDRYLYFDMGTLFQRFLNYVSPALFLGKKADPAQLDAIHEALGWLNGFLEGHSFCVGNKITVADFVLIATVSTIMEAGIDVSKYSNVKAWVERCKSQMVGYESENGFGAKQFGGFAKSKLS